ncbi:LANO_0D09032g1_1 [Lachancea nothofagi CBS 11611]|uniref:Mitochondrial distribution and morphology protein 10 n=1 Tax=Lachancea nothofagi CBS 11611 TaxID=1266666 RepID=A0A1G4JJ88_9SACH|nr:LANO_0D09032g1_1 [Lachancea nothofagi CBS 11611]
MIEYMEQVLRSFELCTGWSRDNSYENITATSENLLNFDVPAGLKCQVSNKSTPNTYSTFELSNNKLINGSLAYLYTNCKGLENYISNSRDIQLQDASETYRQIRPLYRHRDSKKEFEPSSLWYGRMYYPTSTLEAMVAKRLSPETQFVAKCLSSLAHTSVLTLYWQKDSGQNCQEWIASSNEGLVGYRVLHNFIGSQSKLNSSLYNNSSLSIGGELWFGLMNTSPACSTTLRYCTHSANTGKPLTLTLSWNPLFGHVSSTYSVKASSGATISSKYDFNLYSIESNLSFGCDLWRSGNKKSKLKAHEDLSEAASTRNSKYAEDSPMFYHLMAGSLNSQKLLDDLNVTFASSLHKINKERSIIQKFENSLIDANFTSVWRLSTSLRDKNLKVLWEGKYKGFLISAGTELTNGPLDLPSNLVEEPKSASFFRPSKFGVQLQYSM